MRFVFVDGENIGLKRVGQVKATLVDKVFVFSKLDSIKKHCEKELFYHFSDYPSGKNQADFYIISHLSRVLSTLEQNAFSSVHFELISDDKELIKAFDYQCIKSHAKCRITKTKDEIVAPIYPCSKPNSVLAEKLIYAALDSPKNLDSSLREQLGVTQQIFTKAVNSLCGKNLIKRSETAKKKWVQC